MFPSSSLNWIIGKSWLYRVYHVPLLASITHRGTNKAGSWIFPPFRHLSGMCCWAEKQHIFNHLVTFLFSFISVLCDAFIAILCNTTESGNVGNFVIFSPISIHLNTFFSSPCDFVNTNKSSMKHVTRGNGNRFRLIVLQYSLCCNFFLTAFGTSR